MKKIFLLILVLSFVSFGASKIKKPKTIKSSFESTEEKADCIRTFEKAVTNLTLNLYSALSQNNRDNIFFSPMSIETALLMAYAGARGQTASNMAKTLGVESFRDNVRLHVCMGEINSILNAKNENYDMVVANKLFGQKGFRLQSDFTKTLSDFYKSELTPVDFAKKRETADIINGWVEKKTNEKIRDLIPQDMLDPSTKLILINAIYFLGSWEFPFVENATEDRSFYLEKGSVEVPMMQVTERFGYADKKEVQVLHLPYKGGQYSSIIILPKARNGIADIEKKLSANFADWTSIPGGARVNVHLPKFKLSSSFKLAQILSTMGMKLPFSGEADFTGITGKKDLVISEVLHKAFIDVNEKGTEAAAATGVVMRITSAPILEDPVVFMADHPFIIIIKDKTTNAPLFIGRIANPGVVE